MRLFQTPVVKMEFASTQTIQVKKSASVCQDLNLEMEFALSRYCQCRTPQLPRFVGCAFYLLLAKCFGFIAGVFKSFIFPPRLSAVLSVWFYFNFWG